MHKINASEFFWVMAKTNRVEVCLSLSCVLGPRLVCFFRVGASLAPKVAPCSRLFLPTAIHAVLRIVFSIPIFAPLPFSPSASSFWSELRCLSLQHPAFFGPSVFLCPLLPDPLSPSPAALFWGCPPVYFSCATQTPFPDFSSSSYGFARPIPSLRRLIIGWFVLICSLFTLSYTLITDYMSLSLISTISFLFLFPPRPLAFRASYSPCGSHRFAQFLL